MLRFNGSVNRRRRNIKTILTISLFYRFLTCWLWGQRSLRRNKYFLRFSDCLQIAAVGETANQQVQAQNWRWEVLEVVLEDLQSMWPVICFFDLALMRGGSNVSNAVYTAIIDAFRDPTVLARVAMLQCVCHRIGHWSRWTEGCSCRWEAIAHCTTWDQRKAVLIALGIPDGEQKAASSFQFQLCPAPIPPRFFVLQSKRPRPSLPPRSHWRPSVFHLLMLIAAVPVL